MDIFIEAFPQQLFKIQQKDLKFLIHI